MENYGDAPLPFKLTRSYYFPPQEEFYIVQYHIENPSTTDDATLEIFDFINSAYALCDRKNYGWYDMTNKVRPNSRPLAGHG
jgi:hypothetical protein